MNRPPMKHAGNSRMRPRFELFLPFTALLLFGALTAALAAPATTPPLYTYDLAPVNKYDLGTTPGKNNAWAEVHVVAALQGLANRQIPRLYAFYTTNNADQPGATDRFWLTHMQEPGGWLAKRHLQPVATIEGLVAKFRPFFQGVVLYDLSVPATSNVASTVAGCDNLLPIPYDPTPGSVYDRLVVHGPKLPIKMRLIKGDGTPLFTGAETGSAKCDAYLWAKRRYLDTGKCDPTEMAYYIDAWWRNEPTKSPLDSNSESNHDFFIARKAFFFDLSPWEDEEPTDDPKQPLGTDHKTLLALLRSAYNGSKGTQMIHVGGFIPWVWKYTDSAQGKHGGVETEWHYAAILSSFNAYMDADALEPCGMANASVFSHFPLQPRYHQPKPGLADWKKAGYVDASGQVVSRTFVTFYVGDYDSAAWFYRYLPGLWTDPARGTIPLGWAFNPNLSERFPVGMDWAHRTASPNDHFMTGDSGAGYINPGNLDGERPYSALPSGLPTWERFCRDYYNLWDVSITGFVIDGFTKPMSADALAAYARFSPDGVIGQKMPAPMGLVAGTTTPYLVMNDDMPGGDQTAEAAARIKARLANDTDPGPHFHIFRTILWFPSQHRKLFEQVQQEQPNVTIVDPYTLMGLLRIQQMAKH